eukprot:TRINITY_DN1165_c0_g2_i1.p1 TRINITY_DN1165_c0_g2~~TRINITY_DN1165_c0_g2_i1.p1  ORF type:complete len:255 (-),score=47.36 TRINITY_DN1165_c0_g2_i1:57-821(-)
MCLIRLNPVFTVLTTCMSLTLPPTQNPKEIPLHCIIRVILLDKRNIMNKNNHNQCCWDDEAEVTEFDLVLQELQQTQSPLVLVPIFQPALNRFDLQLKNLTSTNQEALHSLSSYFNGFSSPRQMDHDLSVGVDPNHHNQHNNCIRMQDSDNGEETSSSQQYTSPPVKNTRKRRFRQRSADVKSLTQSGMYNNPEDPDNDKLKLYIRKWKNDRNMTFYDCKCGRRRAVQDLMKLKRHVISIHDDDEEEEEGQMSQ